MEQLIFYFLMSGWIFSISITIGVCIAAFIKRDKENFKNGFILLIGSILIGYLLFYPIAIAIILLNRLYK